MKGGGVKAILLHMLSLIGYAGSVGLILVLALGLIWLTLSFLGIPMPW